MKSELIKTYKEGNWVAKVEIIEDLSDEHFERYKLKVIEEVNPKSILGTKAGEVFEASWTKASGWENHRIWYFIE